MSIQIIADVDNILGREKFHAKALCLCDDTLSEFRTAHSFRKARIVIEAFGNSRLTTKTAPFDDQDIKAVTCYVDRSCQGCWTSTDNDQIIEFTFCLRIQSQFGSQLCIRWLNQCGTIIKDKQRNAHTTILSLLHKRLAFCILLDVDELITNALFTQKFLAPFTIATPVRSV